MIHIDESELVASDDDLETYQGSVFTGYSADRSKGTSIVTAYLSGLEFGASYEVSHETGRLAKLMPLRLGGNVIGGVFEWDQSGRLKKEKVMGGTGSIRVERRWSKEGSIERDNRFQGNGYSQLLNELGTDFVPWVHRPNAHIGSDLQNYVLDAACLEDDVRWDSQDGRYRLRGEPFWGNLLSVDGNGRVRMRQVLDGRNEGPVWEWAPSGKLVLQGVLHHPHGRVGPWHQWDETGRLLNETIYDALGNHIIDHHFDEAGNLAQEQHHEPTRLWTDPDTGQQGPAPWLWF